MGDNSERVYAAAVSPDGALLAWAGESGTITVSSVATGAAVGKWRNWLPEYARPYPVFSLRFSRSGETLISGGDDYAVKIWGLDGKLLKFFQPHYFVTALDISNDGNTLVTGSSECLNMQSAIKIWDTASGNERSVLRKRWLSKAYINITGLSLSPDGAWLASSSQDGAVRLWDVRRARQKLVLDSPVSTNCVVLKRWPIRGGWRCSR